MKNTKTAFPEQIDKRMYFNEFDTDHIQLNTEYQSLLAQGKYQEASQLLNEADSNAWWYGAWLLNYIKNQLNAIGSYLKTQNGYSINADETWSKDEEVADYSTPTPIFTNDYLEPHKNTSQDIVFGDHVCPASNYTAHKNMHTYIGSYQLPWDSVFYTDSKGTYVMDADFDKAYVDEDGGYYYYPMGGNTKAWKDTNFNGTYKYYYLDEDDNKYYLENNTGEKVLYSQEPGHTLCLPYDAEQYYEDGSKVWKINNVLYNFQDGDPDDDEPSSNLDSYFYYLLDDEDRKYDYDSNGVRFYYKNNGYKYYISDDDRYWLYNGIFFREITLDEVRLDTYRDTLNGSDNPSADYAHLNYWYGETTPSGASNTDVYIERTEDAYVAEADLEIYNQIDEPEDATELSMWFGQI